MSEKTERMELRTSLIELIGGYMTSHALGVMAELGVADHIDETPRSSVELAEATGVHELSLRRMLRMLATVGVTTEPEPGSFGLTAVGRQLRTDSPDSLRSFTRMFCHPLLFSNWQGLEDAIRSGTSSFEEDRGTDFYSYVAQQPQMNALFNEAMGEESRIAAEELATGYDFSSAKRIVDLGGGDGTLLASILTANPHLEGIVFDSPSGVEGARENLREAALESRAEVREGDFFRDIPTDGDLYVIKSVLQDWNDDDAIALLRSCRIQLPPSATLLIVGSVLPDTATDAGSVMFFTDVNMLVNTGGRERTVGEFEAMFTEAGLTIESVELGAAGPLSVIRAVPTAR